MEVQKFMALLEETFDVHCKKLLYTLKFRLLGHVVEYLDRLEA